MTIPEALVTGVAAATAVDVVPHRKKVGATADYIIIATERSNDTHRFGRGLGAHKGGMSIVRLALWYIIPSRVAEPLRQPARALVKLQAAYDYVADRKEIGDYSVVVAPDGLGPMLRSDEDDRDAVVAYARLTVQVVGEE